MSRRGCGRGAWETANNLFPGTKKRVVFWLQSVKNMVSCPPEPVVFPVDVD